MSLEGQEMIMDLHSQLILTDVLIRNISDIL